MVSGGIERNQWLEMNQRFNTNAVGLFKILALSKRNLELGFDSIPCKGTVMQII